MIHSGPMTRSRRHANSQLRLFSTERIEEGFFGTMARGDRPSGREKRTVNYTVSPFDFNRAVWSS